MEKKAFLDKLSCKMMRENEIGGKDIVSAIFAVLATDLNLGYFTLGSFPNQLEHSPPQ